MSQRLSAKGFSLALASCLGLCLLLTACDSAGPATETAFLGSTASIAFDTDGSDGKVDLLAGQNMKVGEVLVKREGPNLLVTYQITVGGACITEWHLDAGTRNGNVVTGIPLTPGGPVPGQFMWKAATPSCVTTVTQAIPLSSVEGWSQGKPVVIAAHAVVRVPRDRNCAYVFGIEHETGKIYKVYLGDLNTPGDETTELVFSPTIGTPSGANWPNGLALAAVNDRLYFTNNTALNDNPANNPLYFIDLATNTQVSAGNLSQRSASAVGIGGDYYYVPQNSADRLRRVTFDAAGVLTNDVVACNDFTGTGSNTPMFFGDIAYDRASGLIYGSARVGTNNSASTTFFSLNPQTCAYTQIKRGGIPLIQLATDCTGTLVGQDTETGTFYSVNKSTGVHTEIGSTAQKFNDLSDGPCACDGGTETAWGAGTRFRDRGNWATYFTFTPPPAP